MLKIYQLKIYLKKIGNIYLREDIKDSIPEFIISVTQQLGFSTDINFIGIPAKKSCSGKFEILINNQKGETIIDERFTVIRPEAITNYILDKDIDSNYYYCSHY